MRRNSDESIRDLERQLKLYPDDRELKRRVLHARRRSRVPECRLSKEAAEILLDEDGEPYPGLEEAVEAYETGGTWVENSLTIDGGDEWAYACDEPETCGHPWHSHWVVRGLRVEDCKLWIEWWTVDRDGNWEVESSACVDDKRERKSLETRYSHESWVTNQRFYWQDVLDTGEDPLGWASVPNLGGGMREVKWHFRVRDTDQGVQLIALRGDGDKDWIDATIPSGVPRYVLDYFLVQLDDQGLAGARQIIRDEAVPNVAALRRLLEKSGRIGPSSRRTGIATGWASWEQRFPPREPTPDEIRDVARRTLERLV